MSRMYKAIIFVVLLASMAAGQVSGSPGVTAGTGSASAVNGLPVGTDTGAVNAYVVANLSPAMTAYTPGATGCFIASANSTILAPTVNFNGLGVKTVVKLQGIGLFTSDISTSTLACMVYDGTNFELLNPHSHSGTGSGVLGSGPTFLNSITTPIINTTTNCAVNSVSPAACGAASSGAVVVPTTTTTYTINTTAVTAASRIMVTPLSFASNLPSAPTCVTPAVTAVVTVSAISAGVSFTLALPSTTGQSCWEYWIVN
jgi:hypothetical protein